MIKKFLLTLIGFVLLIYFLGLSIWLNLSPEKLSMWLQHFVNQKTTNQIEVKIKNVVPRWSGVDISQVLIFDKRSKNEMLDVQYIDININPFQVIFNLGVPLKAEVYNGVVKGKLQFFPTRLNLDVNQINIRQIPLVFNTRLLPAPVYMDIHSTFVLKKILSAEIEAEIQQFGINFKGSRLNNIVKLPTLGLKSLSFKGFLENNELSIQALTTGDIVSKTIGTILINQRSIYNSGLNIQLSGSLSTDYESKIDPLFLLIVKSFKNSSGQIRIKIGGNLQYPNINKN